MTRYKKLLEMEVAASVREKSRLWVTRRLRSTVNENVRNLLSLSLSHRRIRFVFGVSPILLASELLLEVILLDPGVFFSSS